MIKPVYRESNNTKTIVFEDTEPDIRIEISGDGYGMLKVIQGERELERYYGLEMAVDHVAELIGVQPAEIELPDEAGDMGI